MSEIKELIIQENGEYENYEVKQCLLCNEKTLLQFLNISKDTAKRWYPFKFTSLPYIFHHNTDEVVISKRSKLLTKKNQSKVWVTDDSFYKSQIHIEYPLKPTFSEQDQHHDDLAEEKYLQSTPWSFLILSKPNIGEVELGKILANHWKCVFISPEQVIRDEINSGSRVGKCISFNLQNGRGVGPEIILRLVDRRVRSQTAQHTGFVITGFPLIANDFFKIDPLSSESAVFNAEEIFEDLLTTDEIPDRPNSASTMKGSKVSIDITEKSEERKQEDAEGDATKQDDNVEKKKDPEILEDIDLGSDNITIVKATESFAMLFPVENQIKYIFSLFKEPLVIINLFCDNLDVINKTSNCRFNLIAEKEITMEKEPMSAAFSPDFPNFQDQVEFNEFENGNEMKESVKLPTHFNESISRQLVQFKYKLYSFIERRILDQDPQYFIKIDGRLSSQKMFNSIRQRLKILGLQPALTPERISILEEIEEEFGEEPPEPEPRPANMPPEESFEILRKIGTVSPMYKWKLSHWGYKCPVAFKNGKYVKGTAENAIRFMNKIYFLSDLNAVTYFCRNPRPFLSPVRIKPDHRIFVMGPQYSGKTAVTICLSYLFNLHIFDITLLEQEYKNKKKMEYLEKVRTAAITEGLVELQKLREATREQKIDYWMKNIRAIIVTEFPEFKSLMQLYPSASEIIMDQTELELDDDSDKSGVSILSERTHYNLRTELEKLNISLTNKDLLQSLLEDSSKLLEYLPDDLRRSSEPSVHDPFVSNYVKKLLAETDIEVNPLTKEEMIDMFQTAMNKFESNYVEKQGWIVDGFPADVDILDGLSVNRIPDTVICLKDEDPENLFLLARYAKNDYSETVGFKNFFQDLRRFSAAERIPEDAKSFIYSMITDRLKTKSTYSVVDDIEAVQSNKNEEYAEHLSEFNENWRLTWQYFMKNLCEPPIEVNVANKTLPELLKECMLCIENKFRIMAHRVTEDEKRREHADFGGNLPENDEEEDMGEGEPLQDNFQDNRRYGDTSFYCPVAYHDHFVLWKGKEEFTASFENKIYLLSSKEALDAFIENPYIYLMDKPITKIPPPRICISGVIGSGKSTIAKKLADNFGLFYINFENVLLEAFGLDMMVKIDDLLLQEKKDMEMYAKEIEVIRNYHLDEDFVFPEQFLRKVLMPLWFHPPYSEVGFVLDNFPKTINDVNYMKKYFLIPDVIIELQVNLEEVHRRLFHIKFNDWKQQLKLKIKEKEIENELVIKKWQEEYENRVDFLVEVMKEQRKQEFIMSQAPVPPYSSPVESQTTLERSPEDEEVELNMFIYDPMQELEDVEEIRMRVSEELPKPEFYDDWETEEEATQRIEEMLDEIFSRDLRFFTSVKKAIDDENIDYCSMSTQKDWYKVYLEIEKKTEQYKFRNKSFFQRVYQISLDTAEKLLEKGSFFISKFGRTCPVQIYERTNPIQMYLPAEYKLSICPMIFRRYIYFVCGADHAQKFKENPLLYVQNHNFKLPLLPLKIAIIGPPKSGKSFLADKFQREFGLKVVTRGQAARYVLKYLSNFELAKNMRNVLEKGWALTPTMVALAVEAFILDGRSITQGYILDGFPASVDEMKKLQNHGIVPHLFLNILASGEKIEECTVNDSGKKFMKTMAHKFILNRRNEWEKEIGTLSQYLHREFQNVFSISYPENKWDIWSRTKSIVIDTFFEILNFFLDRYLDTAKMLKSLAVVPKEFTERQSSYKNYCPACIYYDDFLVSGGTPPKRTGLAYYQDRYYWICTDHLKEFLNKPSFFIPPFNDKNLPEELPRFGPIPNAPTFQDGLCVVCFWNNQPKLALNQGSKKFTASYLGMIYLFCSKNCEKTFMKEPHKYYNKIIHFRNPLPLELKKKLPTLGYLEQNVAELLTRALVNTEIVRPVHPCMDIETSAATHMALYLKIHNPRRKYEYTQIDQQLKDKFDERREKLKYFIKCFLSTPNPFCGPIEYNLDTSKNKNTSQFF